MNEDFLDRPVHPCRSQARFVGPPEHGQHGQVGGPDTHCFNLPEAARSAAAKPALRSPLQMNRAVAAANLRWKKLLDVA